jgi:hypothetical protein
MTDLLGPANAVNFTTLRPADTRIFPADDTYFKDCTPGARDGTAIQAAFLNGMLMQVRRAIRGMAIAEDNADDDMLLKAIQAAAAGLATEASLLASMPIHAMVGTGGTLAYSTGAGNIVVSTGQTITRRGFKVYNVDNISLANRTFVTIASKTYHLRWYAPGVGRATPPSSWPDGRLYLEDIADLTYNPSALPETNTAFDSTYDSLLLARVVTNGANALTVTALLNQPILKGTFSRGPTKPGTVYTTTHTFNWSRIPLAAMRDINAPGGGQDTDPVVQIQSLDRYAADIYAWAWSAELVAGTQTAPTYGYSFSIGA